LNSPAPGEVTQLLQSWRNGDRGALDRLVPLLQQELRRLAAARLRREPVGVSLQATELVNEAYLRLVLQKDVDWRNRAHFLGIAAIVMRRILVDRARRRRARGFDARVTLDTEKLGAGAPAVDVLAIDEALRDLERLDERQAKVVELRCFGGLSVEEIATSIGASPATVKRDWTHAKAWLARRLRKG
jgi:RNA polymerase sigma factor (TIGR02999 family)